MPSALSTVTSESNIIRIDIENLTDYAFPVPPKIFCYIENKDFQVKEPGVSNFLFSNCNNETIINGYSYGFYEKKIIEISKDEGNMIFYFPKFFITISQYNYYYACYKICKYIHEQFLKDNIEIPLEIQIYNIINFTPCPVNSNLELSLFALNGALNGALIDDEAVILRLIKTDSMPCTKRSNPIWRITPHQRGILRKGEVPCQSEIRLPICSFD